VSLQDEATASVDPETDSNIQDTIRNGFSHCTILCIAHRLATVAFYDRVMVLDQGEILEYDTPLKLLCDPNSRFRSMAEQTGALDSLIRIAEEAEATKSPRQD
jgi:ATP-binding cassette subfamily C (CFTR/MRP) protein 1